MTIISQEVGLVGNNVHADGVALSYDTLGNAKIDKASRPYIVASIGAPTFVAPQGTLCINTSGSSTSTRAYINKDGSTNWAAITTAS